MVVTAFGAPNLLRKRRYCTPRYVWLLSRVEAHSRAALQFIGEMKVRIIFVLFTFLFLGFFFRLLRNNIEGPEDETRIEELQSDEGDDLLSVLLCRQWRK
jgi:hypothetical protein